ncbi:MAG: alpha/beta hydrolase [Eisenbergiella sp.]
MAVSEKQNQSMMNLIRKVHGLVEHPDLNRHRQSQDRIGALLGTEKGVEYTPVTVEDMNCEWVRVTRAHMKKYVILYCHGGGYSTGSTVYARTLTKKLAESTSMDVFAFNYRLAAGASVSGGDGGCAESVEPSDVFRIRRAGRDRGGRQRGRQSGAFFDA